MKEKMESGQLKVRQDATMVMAATEIVTGETEDFRKGDGFRRTFLEILINKKGEIEKSINSLTNGKKEYTDLFSADEIIEGLDRAVLEIAAQTHYSLLERKTKELKKIIILIRRAQHEEEFGLCEECERRIPEGRLLIAPEATLCVPCQREMEKFESGRGLANRSYHTSQGKKEFQWKDDDNSTENEESIVRSGVEHISFVDLEETDVDDNPKEISEK
jgi:DnaK suppressor protein